MITHDEIDVAVRKIAEAAAPDRIVLFGSYARGDAREDSDLDLLAIQGMVPEGRFETAMRHFMAGNASHYMRATDEALAFLRSLRQFADAVERGGGAE